MIRESLKSDSEQRALARAKLVEDRRDSFDKISNQIAGLTMKEIHAARSESRPLSVIEDNLKSLQRASAIIGKCFDISSRALGLEREEMAGDEIPNLVFGELTPTQVQELRKMDEGNSLSDDLEELEELEKSLGAIPDEDDESEDDEEGRVMALPSSLSLIQLHSGQMKVFKAPHRFKVVCAGRRWGKSMLSISMIMRAAAKDRKQRVWYIAPSYQMARQILWDDAE
jgi:hypothetical protein